MHKKMMKEGWEMHKKMMGLKLLVLGALILGNLYFFNLSWPIFAGIALVTMGLLSLIMPCGCCSKHKRRR